MGSAYRECKSVFGRERCDSRLYSERLQGRYLRVERVAHSRFSPLDGRRHTQHGLQMQREFARLVESRRITTVLVTHDVDEAISLADRIFVLSARPTHVIGEVRVAKPRCEKSREEGRAIAARIEALRRAG